MTLTGTRGAVMRSTWKKPMSWTLMNRKDHMMGKDRGVHTMLVVPIRIKKIKKTTIITTMACSWKVASDSLCSFRDFKPELILSKILCRRIFVTTKKMNTAREKTMYIAPSKKMTRLKE